MDINLMKPSDFNKFPFNSQEQSTECEVIAQNIMTILKRTGNIFRPLSWEEYKEQRLKDGEFTEQEKWYFDKVIEYCANPVEAVTFSNAWKEIWTKKNKVEEVSA